VIESLNSALGLVTEEGADGRDRLEQFLGLPLSRTIIPDDGRLQMTSFVREPNTFGHSSYQYHADGRVSFVHNLDNPSFDRKYGYDHVGRLSEGLSGTDARGETYSQDNPNLTSRPTATMCLTT